MKAAFLPLVLMALAACSPEAPQENSRNDSAAASRPAAPPPDASRPDASRPDAAAPAVQIPAGAPPLSGPDAILGAIAGPCGSEKAADFMGRAWSPETEAALKARTGAAGVLVMDEGAAHIPPDERRVSVLLNSRNQIIHLVCG